MAANTPASCSAGGVVASSPQDPETPRCACGVVLSAIVSFDSKQCYACRIRQRSAMSTEALRALLDELQLWAARGRESASYGFAADYEMEARLVELQLSQREAPAHG